MFVTPNVIETIFLQIPGAWEAFNGQGIDLGGGVACISSTIATKPNVQSIYCVEISEDVVTFCHPIVTKTVLQDERTKVISVIGDFNHLQVESDSMDFAVAWSSLHHSYQLDETLTECRRVLKPNGHLVVVERAHNNSTSKSEIERMLNIRYDKAFLRKTYRNPSMTLTRRDNGEHEYRYCEWSAAFENAGFLISSAVVIRNSTTSPNPAFNDANLLEVSIEAMMGGHTSSKVGYLLNANK